MYLHIHIYRESASRYRPLYPHFGFDAAEHLAERHKPVVEDFISSFCSTLEVAMILIGLAFMGEVASSVCVLVDHCQFGLCKST